ncbi:Gfo/Idh/MocA family protein [Pareuzebyella sediminis]|uniref:Gfo/Idh/MocA family protein n=1 Tax=Pareuzebyella sediminis TaxID=2607998 RepID=UPI0011EE24E0|nr:Gfo/Idh/MocA family oxidoreductase [Pareuzebyella sediminis]
MEERLCWGILGTATIAVDQVIPAMLDAAYCKIVAIASRSEARAKEVAQKFGIAKSYGDYSFLLEDPKVQAVYIPLPNHLHVEWAIKALRASKHVLVEKPIALHKNEALQLAEEIKAHPRLKVMEAFMYKFHPQWVKTKQMVDDGQIGHLKMVQASFSFFEDDSNSIVNNKSFGGGSLMDIGCYPVSVSRFLFGAEPKFVFSNLEYDPDSQVDIHASGTLEFEQGQAIFFSSIRLAEHQEVKLFGTQGSIELELPFNPHGDRMARIWWSKDAVRKEIAIPQSNQYTLQVDAFSKAILNKGGLPFSLDDAIANMAVIDALVESDRLGKAIAP